MNFKLRGVSRVIEGENRVSPQSLNLGHGGDSGSGSGSSRSAGQGEGAELLDGDGRQNHGGQEGEVGEEQEGNSGLGLSASALGALGHLVGVDVVHVAARVASDGGGQSGTSGKGQNPGDEVNDENDNGEGNGLNEVGEHGVEHTKEGGPCATEDGVRHLGVVVALLVGGGERTGQTHDDGGKHENESSEDEIGDLDHCCRYVLCVRGLGWLFVFLTFVLAREDGQKSECGWEGETSLIYNACLCLCKWTPKRAGAKLNKADNASLIGLPDGQGLGLDQWGCEVTKLGIRFASKADKTLAQTFVRGGQQEPPIVCHGLAGRASCQAPPRLHATPYNPTSVPLGRF